MTDLVHETVSVPADDGTRLYTEVFRPAGANEVPAAFHATPYGAHLQRDDARRHAADGMAIVTQDVRGRFGSEGVFDLGASAGEDGAASVRWIRAQPWSDGRVVGRGASFGGFTQQAAAVVAPDLFDSIAPVMAPDPWNGLSFRGRGGPVRLALLAHWLLRQAAGDAAAADSTADALLLAAFEHYQVLSAMDGYAAVNPDLAVAHPTVGGTPAEPPPALDALPHWRALWDAAWDGPSVRAMSELRVPSLITIGWYDLFVADAVEVHGRSSHPDNRLVIVPSGHGFHLLQHPVPPDGHRYGLDVDHRWACERLLGADHGLASAPRVTYWTFGVDEWRTASSWPPPGTTTLVLRPGAGPDRGTGTLDADPPPGRVVLRSDPAHPYPTPGGASLGFPPGPVPLRFRSGTERADVATFLSQPLPTGVSLAGPVRAHVTVSTDAADTDVVVVLSLVDPKGTALAILNGASRARHVVPGADLSRPTTVPVALGPIAWEVPAGHRLRLDVTTSDFPRHDRNLHTGGPEGREPIEAAVVADVVVHTGTDVRTEVELTIAPDIHTSGDR